MCIFTMELLLVQQSGLGWVLAESRATHHSVQELAMRITNLVMILQIHLNEQHKCWN